jgi:hypothetical protein
LNSVVPAYKFAVNLKFMEIDSMHGALPSFAKAEELLIISKLYDTAEEAKNDAVDVLHGLCETLEKKKLGVFKLDIERNLLKVPGLEDEEETEELRAEAEEFDEEEWADNELLKMWIYEIESNPSMIIPVALVQLFEERIEANRTYS